MTQNMLMFVQKVTEEGMAEFLEVGGCRGTMLPHSCPDDLAGKLVGRWAWVSGDVGLACKLVSWIPLPKSQRPTPTEEKPE